ncbi:MAG: redoxin domain-containing protein [Chloroflexi bacterium]|nr:redoxin domain-containing protein [Chloroflexota bacterium]
MAQLRQQYDKYVEVNTEILVIGREDAGSFAGYWQKHDLPFPGLPDPTLSVLKLYGQEVNLFKFGRVPAQMIIDRCGVARYVHYSSGSSDIPANEEILELLNRINLERVQQ